MSDVTLLLDASMQGDDAAFHQLFSLLYGDLRQLARARLRRREPITLPDTTSLVHETYLRCLEAGRLQSNDRLRFMGYAARALRSVIVDSVRQHSAERRGGRQTHVTLDTTQVQSVRAPEDEIVRVSEALDELSQADPRLVRVVEMRYYAGMNEAEIAECLGVNERTVRRDWQRARLLLSLALQD
jgi:RNA polymerase sigma factor (TIGR02999 family)